MSLGKIIRLNWLMSVNSVVPGRSGCNIKIAILNLALLTGIFQSSYDNVLIRMLQDLTVYKSILIQVIAWCCEATCYYLS